MAQIVFKATTTAGAATTGDATTSTWLDIPEWAPDIDYIPTGVLAGNLDWAQFTEPTLAASTDTANPLFSATSIGKYTARQVVFDNHAIVKNEKVTLCYREAGALVRT